MSAKTDTSAGTRRRRREQATADGVAANLELEDRNDILLETGTLLLLEAIQ